MARHLRLSTCVLNVALLILLGACGSAPPKPTLIQGNLAVAADVNPDASGRASPVMIRLYELKTLTAFQNADYFSLYERGKETLGPELVASEEINLRPGEKKKLDRQLQPDTRYIAAVAAYRDLERASWRAAAPVKPNQTTLITIQLHKREISITNK